MPHTPPRPCRHPACPALVYDGSGYCAAHAGDKQDSRRKYDSTRKDSEHVRTRRASRWRKLSEVIRAQNPLCCDPYGDHARDGLAAFAAQVHHIVSAEERPDLMLEVSNTAPVCTKCHARTEAAERKGEPTAHLFAGKTSTLNCTIV